MPITPVYQVMCDVCYGVMDGEFDTREGAERARKEMGWEEADGRTACPRHSTATYRTTEK